MQKHDETDEVFVLLEGDFTLFLGGNGEHIGEIEAIKLEPLKLYNVKKGTYHTHTPEKNSTVLIVENVDTTDDNSPKEKLTLEQKKIIERQRITFLTIYILLAIQDSVTSYFSVTFIPSPFSPFTFICSPVIPKRLSRC